MGKLVIAMYWLRPIQLHKNKGRPILSAAKMLSMNSSFWQYKVYVDIRGGSPNFYENFCQAYVHLSPYIVLVTV